MVLECKKIKNVALVTTNNIICDKVEIRADVENISGNFYDYEKITLDIEMISPKGETYTVAGFYYVPYAFKSTGELIGVSDEAPSWRFRVMPTETGVWKYKIILKEDGVVTDTEVGNFIVGDNDDKRGVLGIEPIHRRNFMFEDGTVHIPIGENLAWSWPVKDRENAARYISNVMRKGSAYGMNFARLWNAFWCLSIQNKNYAPDDFTGGQYSAAQFDRIFEAMKETDVYVSFVFFSHGMFSREIDPVWHDNPYNSANPYGYLEEPVDFFTDERAIHDAKCYIRYVIARYGYSRNVMDWELFNEADYADGEPPNTPMPVKTQWHKKMTEYIRSIDPYNHMVITSGAYATTPISRNDFFDFTVIHWYNYERLRDILQFYRLDWESQKRPSFYSEIGLNKNKPFIDEDLISFHHTNWLGVMSGMAATCMTWYWELVDSLDAYSDFKPLSDFAKTIPWTDPDFDTIETEDLSVSNSQVEIFGYSGKNYAYLWIYDDNYRHLNKVITNFDAVVFTVPLADGSYNAEWINTWTGETVLEEEVIAKNGKCVIKTPKWKKDLAIRITTL